MQSDMEFLKLPFGCGNIMGNPIRSAAAGLRSVASTLDVIANAADALALPGTGYDDANSWDSALDID
jgi:hypothetical protein